MSRQTCLEGGTTHAWESLGLDVNGRDELVNVRRCVWCQREQERPYGAIRSHVERQPWETSVTRPIRSWRAHHPAE